MRERVKAILERELKRIDERSQDAPLELDDFRTLDLLIKACKSFDADKPNPDQTPEALSTEDLLKDIKE